MLLAASDGKGQPEAGGSAGDCLWQPGEIKMEKLPLFDTHAHLDVEEFDADREELLRKIGETMAGIIDPGCDLLSSKKAVALAHQYPFVCGRRWASIPKSWTTAASTS